MKLLEKSSFLLWKVKTCVWYNWERKFYFVLNKEILRKNEKRGLSTLPKPEEFFLTIFLISSFSFSLLQTSQVENTVSWYRNEKLIFIYILLKRGNLKSMENIKHTMFKWGKYDEEIKLFFSNILEEK